MSETVFIKGETGSVFEMSIPLHEAIEDRLTKGYLTRVNEDGTPWVPKLERRKPYANESKAEWVGWAVSKGLDPEDAEALTKTDLIERYGVN